MTSFSIGYFLNGGGRVWGKGVRFIRLHTSDWLHLLGVLCSWHLQHILSSFYYYDYFLAYSGGGRHMIIRIRSNFAEIFVITFLIFDQQDASRKSATTGV